MRKFLELFEQLDSTTSTNEKIAYLKAYFVSTPAEDAIWALFFLLGARIKRLISGRLLIQWCQEKMQIPDWLLAECYAKVGDSAELVSLLLPSKPQHASNLSLDQWMTERILPLQNEDKDQQKVKIQEWWSELSQKEIFILNKILTSGLRVGVSSLLTTRALSEAFNIEPEIMSLRLSGEWQPTEEFYKDITAQDTSGKDHLNPYPFYLASPLEQDLETLGPLDEWSLEWKWDGIRAQIVVRNGMIALWSRGQDLITDAFPEIASKALEHGTDYVLDGEILVYEGEKPKPFAELQKRLGRKKLSKQVLSSYPAIFMVYDVLEWKGNDLRKLPFSERRSYFPFLNFIKSESLTLTSWQEAADWRLKALEYGTEGLMLKRKSSAYGTGRQRGHWWKYKVDPKQIDAVLMYAQAGSGRRSGLYTDYTFGVWEGNELIPVAKAYSGLTQEEIKQVDKWIRANTIEKFGPVRHVKPGLVFEIAFEGIQVSKRHKSGVALRFPRMSRWRQDKTAEMADKLEDVKKLIL